MTTHKAPTPATLFTYELYNHNYNKGSGISDLVVAEIGVFIGENALSILKYLPIKKLYLIDPYKMYRETINDTTTIPYTNQKLEESYDNAKQLLQNWGNVCEFIKKPSREAVIDFPDKYFDYVYIDGNHSYNSVKEDIELYYPKVRSGGVLGGHDFCSKYRGVVDAVLEFVEKERCIFYNKIDGYNSDWWFIKSNICDKSYIDMMNRMELRLWQKFPDMFHHLFEGV